MTLQAVPDPPPSGYHFDVTCPACGGTLTHVNSVNVSSAVRRALLLCGCQRRWIVTVTIRPERKDER